MASLIGIAGYARSGKDTFGAVLEDFGYETIGFADPMRAAALAIDPIVGRTGLGRLIRYSEALEVHGYDLAKSQYPELRDFLQRLGTEFGRKQLGENFWVNLALENYSAGKHLAITDVRFRNEALGIKARGGIVVRMERDGVGPANDHISEHDLDGWCFDLAIFNNGPKSELVDQARVAMSH